MWSVDLPILDPAGCFLVMEFILFMGLYISLSLELITGYLGFKFFFFSFLVSKNRDDAAYLPLHRIGVHVVPVFVMVKSFIQTYSKILQRS